MNPREENLTHWWCKFLIQDRGYDMLIRNLDLNQNGEFDGIGVRFDRKFESDPWIENIESKLGHDPNPLSTAEALKIQLHKNCRRAFNVLIAVSNLEEALDTSILAYPFGLYLAEIVEDRTPYPKSSCLRDPGIWSGLRSSHREPILKAVRQFYKAAANIGSRCLFIRCQKKNCPYFYGYPSAVPPPEMQNEFDHSFFCHFSKNRREKYAFGSEDVTKQGSSVAWVRINKPI